MNDGGRAMVESLEVRRLFSAVSELSGAGAVVSLSAPPAAVHVSRLASTVTDLSGTLRPLVGPSGAPGVVAGALENGRLVALGSAGVRRTTSGQALRPSDAMLIGSCTKSITATLVGRLTDAGRFSFDLTVAQVFPELPADAKARYGGVTVAQLLGHRSGLSDANVLPDDPSNPPAGFPSLAGSARKVRARFVPYVFSTPPSGTPGESFEYSNTGYAMVAAMLERRTGASFESLMSRWVFSPLGMKTARLAYPSAVSGHGSDGSPTPKAAQIPQVLDAAGKLSVNISDWAKYLSVHLGEKVKGKDFLKPETLTRLHTPLPGEVPEEFGTGYALGWSTTQVDGENLLVHDGDDDAGFVAIAVLKPESRSAIMAQVNRTGDAGRALLGSVVSTLTDSYLS